MRMLKQTIIRFWCDETGATAIEYALLAAFIAGVITASVAALGGTLLSKYDYVATLRNSHRSFIRASIFP